MPGSCRGTGDERRVNERSEPRRENLYLTLREDILSCALAPGQSLHESELATRFAVSKSPVRDALMRLEAERLVTVQPRKGYRVAPVSLSDASDIFDLRLLMETATAQQAAANASDPDLAALDRFRDDTPWKTSGTGFVSYNREFHVALTLLCPNGRIRAAARDIIEQLDRLVVLDLATARVGDSRAMVVEHNAIIDALQAREGRKAGRLLAQHIERAKRRILTSLASTAIVP